LRIIFFGTPEFAVLPLKSLINAGHKVLAVVTQPDRESGRGRHIVLSPVKIEAQSAGLEILQPQNIRDAAFIENVRALNPSVIVVVAYGKIFPPEIIHLPESGCVNVHASLLPKYRGAAPINWAIINGAKKTGITTMLMDEGMDTGPVLLQEETGIKADDTAGSLSVRLSKTGVDVLAQTLKKLEEGNLRPVPQAGDVSYAPVLKKADGIISWSKPADELCDFIRGMNPWPGACSFLGNERIKFLKAVSKEGDAGAGMIMKVSKSELLIGTGKGLLSILEIQPAGKPLMTVRAFLQGRAIKEGVKFHEQGQV